MVIGEGVAFCVLLAMSGVVLAWFSYQDQSRARLARAFFAGAAHELRTPLASIRMQAEALRDGVQGAHFVMRLLEDTERLEHQVEKMLELVRLEGGGRLCQERIDLSQCLKAQAALWPDLQVEAIEPCWVQADPWAIRIMLRNVFENAMKHSGQTCPTISTRVEQKGSTSVLVLRDNGQGADKALQLGRLFETRSPALGQGVGLYLIRLLAERMGGWASFSSSNGFEVKLAFSHSHC